MQIFASISTLMPLFSFLSCHSLFRFDELLSIVDGSHDIIITSLLHHVIILARNWSILGFVIMSRRWVINVIL